MDKEKAAELLLFEHQSVVYEAPQLTNLDILPLAELWDEPLVFVKQFAQATGSIIAGFFLSYFTEKCAPGTWVALNESIIQFDCGLQRTQWMNVRKQLLATGMLLNKRSMHVSLYSLDEHALEQCLKRNASLHLTDLASRPLSINKLQFKTLISFGLSVKSCILLSLIQELSPHRALNDRLDLSDWIILSDKIIHDRTCLSKKETEPLLKRMQAINLIEVKYCGFPRYRSVCFSLKRLSELTLAYMEQRAI